MVTTGYTRQASGSIVTGATIQASHFNSEYNAIEAAFSATSGHNHDGTSAAGQPIPPAALTPLISSSAGLVAATGSNTFAVRTIIAPAAGITVTNGSGASGNPTLVLANDLAALEGLASTGIAVRSASDTWVQRTVTGTADRVTITDGSGVSGNPTIDIASTYIGQSTITTLGTITTGVWNGTAVPVANGGTGATDAGTARTNLGLAIGTNVQAYDADLAALAGLSSNGMIARTGAGTAAVRTITGTANQITVGNGDGVSGNPTLSLPIDIHVETITADDTIYGVNIFMENGSVTIPAFGFTNDDDTGLYRIGANNLGITTGGNIAAAFRSFSSAVNYIELAGAPSGSLPTVNAAGSGADVTLGLIGKGLGSVDSYSNSALQMRVTPTASADNWIDITGGNAATVSITANSTNNANVPITISSKGTGAVDLKTNGTSRLAIDGSGQVTGTVVASQAELETGTAVNKLVTPGRMQNHPGVAKAWVNFNGDGSINGSYNVTSVTKNTTGDYTITFTVAFSDNTYAGVSSTQSNGLLGPKAGGTKTASAWQWVNAVNDAGTLSDVAQASIVFYGDQ